MRANSTSLATKCLAHAADPFALHTVDVGDGELAGEEGVFAERFEVAATEWVASEVDRGCEQNVGALPFRLAPKQCTGLGNEISVEGGTEADRCGKAHGGRTGGRVTAGAVWAVGHLDRTDSEPFDLGRLPGVAAGQQPDPFLHGQVMNRWPLGRRWRRWCHSCVLACRSPR